MERHTHTPMAKTINSESTIWSAALIPCRTIRFVTFLDPSILQTDLLMLDVICALFLERELNSF